MTLEALIRLRLNDVDGLALSSTFGWATALIAWANERTSLPPTEGTVAVGKPKIDIAEGLQITLTSSSVLNATESSLVRLVENAALRSLCDETLVPCNLTTRLSEMESDKLQRRMDEVDGNASLPLLPPSRPAPPNPPVPPSIPPLPSPSPGSPPSHRLHLHPRSIVIW